MGSGVTGILDRQVLRTPLDRGDGAIGAKRLVVLSALILVLGATAIFFVQRYIAGIDTWRATVTGVARGTVNFTFKEGSNDIDVASYPAGMAVSKGDRVVIRIDDIKGNLVLRVLDD